MCPSTGWGSSFYLSRLWLESSFYNDKRLNNRQQTQTTLENLDHAWKVVMVPSSQLLKEALPRPGISHDSMDAQLQNPTWLKTWGQWTDMSLLGHWVGSLKYSWEAQQEWTGALMLWDCGRQTELQHHGLHGTCVTTTGLGRKLEFPEQVVPHMMWYQKCAFLTLISLNIHLTTR